MKFFITTSFLLLTFLANANDKTLSKTEIKYLNDIVAKSSPSDFGDMEKLLNQLEFKPSHKDSTTGVQLFKVTKVEKNSIFEKAGIKIGDIIANGSSPKK